MIRFVICQIVLFFYCLGYTFLNANPSQHQYHVVIIDTYQMIRKASLNQELQKLHNSIVNDKYFFYYCYYSSPYIAKKSEDMEKLYINISNNNPVKINTEEDYLRIVDMINSEDCFFLNNGKIEMQYSAINFHFFFDTQNYINTDIFKLFLRKFILFNHMININRARIKYKLYLDEQRYNRMSSDDIIKISNPLIEILKY